MSESNSGLSATRRPVVFVAGAHERDVQAVAQTIAAGLANASSIVGGNGRDPAALVPHLIRINLAAAARLPAVAGVPTLSARTLPAIEDRLPYAEAGTLLKVAQDHGGAVLADSGLCSLMPFWCHAAEMVGVEAAVVLTLSPPVEADAGAMLGWLQRMTALEAGTRDLPRRVVLPAGAGLAAQWVEQALGGKAWPGVAGPQADPPGHGVLPANATSLARRLWAALRHVALFGDDDVTRRECDSVRAELAAALALFIPLLEERAETARRLQLRNDALDSEVQELKSVARDVDATSVDGAAELEAIRAEAAQLAPLRVEVAALRVESGEASAEKDRLQSVLLDTRVALGGKQADQSRSETILVNHAQRLLRVAERPGFGALRRQPRAVRALQQHLSVVEAFLDELPWPVIGVHPDGRRERILAYLAGASEALADFPIVRNTEYSDMYPDVAGSGMLPLVHFILHGQQELRSPHPLFDTAGYVQRHPEAVHLASSAIVHFLRWGANKDYDPHPLFSLADYRRRYTDVATSGANPLVHWLGSVLCAATPLFDPDFYLTTYPDVADAGRNPLSHYLTLGWQEGRNPNPWFDTRDYQARNPDSAQAGTNPLIHYATVGWRARSAPGPAFDPAFYLANDPGLDAHCDPLRHFLEHGRAEGRLTVPEAAVAAPAVAGVARPAKRVSPQPNRERLPRIALIVDAFYPRPDQDSGSLDHLNFARIFQRLGYEVHYLALLEFHDDHDTSTSRYRAAMAAMGVHCVTSDDHTFVEEYYFAQSDLIATCLVSRVHFGGQQIDALRRLCPNAWIIFNTVDLHFMREEREGTLKNEPALLVHARRTREMELDFASRADSVIVVSSTEKAILDELVPEANTHVVPLIRSFEQPIATPFAERAGLAFVGGYSHQPNVDAVEFFLAEIWPHVHARRPDMVFSVIGANLPPAWAQRSIPGVRFVGFVEDLEQQLARLRLTVAPLRYGAGAKGKLVSSLAAGVPAVVSPIAAEGMGLVDGETVLVAELGPAFADAIIAVHDQEHLWTRMSAAGAAFIRQHYSIDAGQALLQSLIPGTHLP